MNKPTDIIDRLEDLILQATTERSHYYVASVAKDAAQEIRRLRGVLDEIERFIRETEERIMER